MIYCVVRCVSRLISAAPVTVRYAIADLVGALGWLILPHRRREMAIGNIERGLSVSRSAARQIAKHSTTRFGRMIAELFYHHRLTRSNIDTLVTFRGREYLDRALAEGKGVILATAHTGNWELIGAALALNDYPVVGIAQKQHSEQMDRFINEQRRAPGTEIVYRSEVRDIVRLLDQGKIIGLLMDQDAHKRGIFVDFLGRPASTPQGPAAIARLRGAPIVPMFISEIRPGLHEIIIHPGMHVEKTADRDADIYSMTERLTRIVEDHIRQHPGEWFWLHNRWKTQPKKAE